MFAAGLLALQGGQGLAEGGGGLKDDVQKIADALKKGDEATAKKLAAALAKKDDDPIFNTMVTMKPADDKKNPGFPLGKGLSKNGIEDMVREIAKNGIKADEVKGGAAALEEMGYRIEAIAHVIKNTQQKKMQKLWADYGDNMVKYAQDFNQAIKSGDAAAVSKIATKMDANCNQCHEKFR
jgi:hypothetical protein